MMDDTESIETPRRTIREQVRPGRVERLLIVRPGDGADEEEARSELEDLPGVVGVTINTLTSSFDIAFDSTIVSDDELAAALQLHGYELVSWQEVIHAAQQRIWLLEQIQVLAPRAELELADRGTYPDGVTKGSVDAYRLRGIVSELDRAARRFRLGGQPVSYAELSAADVPADLANGHIVKLRLRTVPVGGVWIAEGLRDGAPQVEDRDDARIEGRIDAFVSAGQFSVNGLPVDASAADFKDGATAALLAVGVEVEIRGPMRDGVLRADEVKVDDHDDGNSGNDDAEDEQRLQRHGETPGMDQQRRHSGHDGRRNHVGNGRENQPVAGQAGASGQRRR